MALKTQSRATSRGKHGVHPPLAAGTVGLLRVGETVLVPDGERGQTLRPVLEETALSGTAPTTKNPVVQKIEREPKVPG